MTTGEKLVSLSGLIGVSAMQHLLGITAGAAVSRFVDWNGVFSEGAQSVISVLHEDCEIVLDQPVAITIDVRDANNVSVVGDDLGGIV